MPTVGHEHSSAEDTAASAALVPAGGGTEAQLGLPADFFELLAGLPPFTLDFEADGQSAPRDQGPVTSGEQMVPSDQVHRGVLMHLLDSGALQTVFEEHIANAGGRRKRRVMVFGGGGRGSYRQPGPSGAGEK